MSAASKFRLHDRWSLFAVSAAAITLASLWILLRYGDPEGVRLVIRVTARTSLLFFTLAFTASALMRLLPSAMTRWQARNRRYLGLIFAYSHFVHLAAIVALAVNSPALFKSLSNPVTIGTGALAYLFIALMAVTSFSAPRRWIGEGAWAWLHWSGGWYIWISFLVATGKRAVHDPFYIPFVAVVGLILALRMIAGTPNGATEFFAASR
ncbi:MAG: hypothetical protein JWL86_4577 [Rhizobium sp.]|nr:hypothetical protein [Rhizobium sp.]